MCFSPKVASVAPMPPTPTPAATGDTETTAAADVTARKNLRAASGFSQNILSGAPTTTGTPAGTKSVLG